MFGKSLVKYGKPAYFPEQELRQERQMGENDDEEFNKLDKMVMGRSIEDFKANRRSQSQPDFNPLPKASATDSEIVPNPPPTTTDEKEKERKESADV